MITDERIKSRFLEAFSVFSGGACKNLQHVLFQHALHMSLPAGTVIAEPGVECTRLALLLGGRVRVYKLAESGREITLYRIHAGESCVLTASCILNMTNFTALAVVESAVEAVILPAGLVRQWLDRYAPWRAFVFGLINQRLEDLMTTIDQVAFRRMDARIADWLMTAKNSAGRVATTHQRIADDLGTSREVVSRILKDFEQDGAIDLSRGEVWLRNMDLLPSRFNSGT